MRRAQNGWAAFPPLQHLTLTDASRRDSTSALVRFDICTHAIRRAASTVFVALEQAIVRYRYDTSGSAAACLFGI
jgi:hypothetical protein